MCEHTLAGFVSRDAETVCPLPSQRSRYGVATAGFGSKFSCILLAYRLPLEVPRQTLTFFEFKRSGDLPLRGVDQARVDAVP